MCGREPRETAGVTTRLIVRYVRRHAGDAGVARVLDLAGDDRPAEVLEDESRWSSYDQKIALFEAAAAVLDDPHVARSIGRTVLAAQVAAPTKLALRALGSPAMVLRSIPRVSARFSTAASMRAVAVSRNRATIEYVLHDRFRPSRHDCDYNQGLLPAATELFGLPPARIAHPECQVEGAPRCLYELEWTAHVRLPWRAARARIALLEDQLRTVVEHSNALQSTVVDLVSPADLATVLDRIATRAAAAVQAQRYLLVVRPEDGGEPVVIEDGFGEVAGGIAADLLAAGGDDPSGRMLVVPVRSARRDHGYLAAFYDEAHRFFPAEARVLEAYARHAAVALDIATALEEARRREETNTALLDLAAALAEPGSVDDVVARLGEAVRGVVNAGRSSVALFDTETNRLRVRALSGYPEEVVEVMRDFSIGFDDTPELRSFFFSAEQRHYSLERLDDPFLRAMLESAQVTELLVVPILIDGAIAGVITASNAPDDPPLPPPEQLARRMAGLADQAALALERARLLEHERAAVRRLERDEARIRHLAYHDTLTGLANGRLFNEHLTHAIAGARRNGTRVAVLFCDLDRFKNVNDSLGHYAGDRLLQEMASRLRGCVREADVLARLGGDEFSVLLEGVHAPTDAQLVAEKILDAARRPVHVDGHVLHVSASVGIALFPDDGDDAEALLKNADAAMYDAKRHRGAWSRYAPEMTARTRHLLLLESGLHGAVERDELVVHYQPQVDAAAGTILGFEALVRWEHPTVGLVPPAEFVPLAEEAGLILRLDRRVLRTACADAARWCAAGQEVRVAVNVSPRHVQQPGLVTLVAETLDATGLRPELLELELTETAAVHVDAVAGVLHELRALGVVLALDDFGTGHAVYRHLRDLPIGRIKLDRSFVAGLPDDRHDRAIVAALVGMAHELGMRVTAEGVETEEQAAFLRDVGCEELQGFLFAPPAAAADATAMLARGRLVG